MVAAGATASSRGRQPVGRWGAGMNLWQRVQCVVGSHERDRKRAHFDGEQFRSICSGCGKPMVKTRAGWIVERAVAVQPPSANREGVSSD